LEQRSVNLVSVIIGAASLIVVYIFGYWQGRSAQRSLDLSVIKATPKVGTAVRIDKRQENPPAFPAFYYLIATIYNEGELPAKQLKGYCRVYSATKGVTEHNIPIEREFLGTTPSELELCRLEDGISGSTLDIGTQAGKNIRFNVDIDFSYFGVEDDIPERYSAQYEYDNNGRQMKRKNLNHDVSPNNRT
jgi:hypothetical protein